MSALLLLASGGALGALLRFWITRGWTKLFPRNQHLPYPTLLVNLLGSALLGALFALHLPDPSTPIQEPLLLFAGIGFCGALTTFSSFTLETITLSSQSLPRAALYLLLTIAGSLAAFALLYFLLS